MYFMYFVMVPSVGVILAHLVCHNLTEGEVIAAITAILLFMGSIYMLIKICAACEHSFM